MVHLLGFLKEKQNFGDIYLSEEETEGNASQNNQSEGNPLYCVIIHHVHLKMEMKINHLSA